MRNIIAIVGRPNVGKSTLFNRLTETREAIVDEVSGVTRDRHYGTSDWNGKEFSVIDTGGYLTDNEDTFNEEIRKQVTLAIEEADIILFLLDAKDGITPMDEDVANILRRTDKPVYVVANKVDHAIRSYDAAEFYQLGLGEVYQISSINGSGTGDLLDVITADMQPEASETEDISDLPRIAVVGRPNVGKSSLINALIGSERNIVSDVAGTTRDATFTRYNLFGFDFFLVDTAGLRKKGKVSENIEFYSVMRSVRAIENSDVCILMLDATQGIENQDVNIFGLIERNNKGVVIVVNKWDLIEKNNHSTKEYEQLIREKVAPFQDIPIIFTSVTTKQRIFKVLEQAQQVFFNRQRRISTSELNNRILPIVKEQNPPPIYKDKRIKINYITQLPTAYPAFVFFCNLPKYIKDSYKRFVENKMREMYEFTGTPIRIFFRDKN